MADPFVLDCSVVMSWCFEDEASDYADSVLEALKDWPAIGPCILLLEVGNVLLVAEKHKRISRQNSFRFISLLQDLPISIVPEPAGRATSEIFALARSYQLSTYDASYLDLALRRGVALATRDRQLQKAARRSKVELFDIRNKS